MQPFKNISSKPIGSRFNGCIRISILSLGILSSAAYAQQVVSLRDALSLTFTQAPQLETYIYQAQAALGRVEQAGVSSPITMDLAIEDAFGSGSTSGISAMQTTLSLSWLLDKKLIDSRLNVATARTGLSEINRDLQAVDLAAQTATIFVQLLSQQEKLKLAKLAEAESQESLDNIRYRVKAGKLSVIDQLRAEADLSKKTLLTEGLTHEIVSSKVALAAQWNGNTDFVVEGSLFNIPTAKALDASFASLQENPKLKLFAEQKKITQSEIALARNTQNPAWKVTAGVKRDELVDDFSFVAGISVPLGGSDRNKGKIIALNAEKSQQQVESDAWVKQITTQLLLLNQKLTHSRHVIDSLNTTTVPLLESAGIKAKDSYLAGSYNFTDWYSVRQELINAQYDLIDAYTNVHINNIEFERLSGVSITD